MYNLIDYDEYVYSMRLNSSNGLLYNNTDFVTSDFIQINPNNNYILSPKLYSIVICFYDVNKNYITGLFNPEAKDLDIKNINQNTVYIRFSAIYGDEFDWELYRDVHKPSIANFVISFKNKSVEIFVEGNSDPTKNIQGTPDLFKLTYDSEEKDKSQIIMTSEAEINIYEDDYFNIDNLATSGETDIKLVYSEFDESTDNWDIMWTGFVLPDFFQTDISSNRVVRMIATDRIGALKNVVSDTINTVPIKILAEKLQETGLVLNINESVTDASFTNGNINTERIEGESSYDIIKSFLNLYNAKLFQYKNAWWIVNKKYIEDGVESTLQYDSDGIFRNVLIHDTEIIAIEKVDVSGQREIKPVASEVSLSLEFGGSKKYPTNWNFEKYSTPQSDNNTTFNGWTSVNGFVQKVNTKSVKKYNKYTGPDGTWSYTWYAEFEPLNDLVSPAFWSRNRNFNFVYGEEIMTKAHVKSPLVNIPFVSNEIEISFRINFLTMKRSGVHLPFLFMIKVTNSNGSIHKWWVIKPNGQLSSAGTNEIPSYTIFNFGDYTNVGVGNAEEFSVVETIYDEDFYINKTDLDIPENGKAESQIFWFGYFEPKKPVIYNTIDVFLNSAEILFNKNEQVGKGLIFKVKQGGAKFSKTMDERNIFFSDKINRGLNGYFYNYKYDDTSIITGSSSIAIKAVREMSNMFGRAREFLSLSGDIKINPLAKYKCGDKYYVLTYGQSRRTDSSVELEEIVTDNLEKKDYIYTFFD